MSLEFQFKEKKLLKMTKELDWLWFTKWRSTNYLCGLFEAIKV